LLAKLKVGLKPSTVALILQTRKRCGLTRPEVFVANGTDRSRSREARMADIFLSYASSDRAKAHLIVGALLFGRPSRGQVNLLSPENGGKLIRAPNDSWLRVIDGDDDTGLDVGYAEAVFGFKDDRSATFDTFTVFIPGPSNSNLKDFELLAGNESPTGRFELIGNFSTRNERVMQLREGRLQAYQEFHFARVKAKYVKIRLLSNYVGVAFLATHVSEFRLFGTLD
jgi:hypothetical protein